MTSDLDIEILTIDDCGPAVKTVLNKTKNPLKKKRTVRKSTGVGGKAAHRAIAFKPLRKSVPVKSTSPRKTRNAAPEYFDVEDDESEEDDEIQVIESDPLNDVEVLSDGLSEGFCDMCGLYLENMKDMEKHLESDHKLVSCKWCQTRMDSSKIKIHIGSKTCPNFTKLLGSLCSIHNEMETDDQLEMEEFKNCRLRVCDTCTQRYDIKSLREFDEASKCFVCPGCLHGRIDASKDKKAETAQLETISTVSTKESGTSSNSDKTLVTPEKTSSPVHQFLSTPNPVALPEILLLDDFDEPYEAEESVKVEESVKAETKIEEETSEDDVTCIDTKLKSPQSKNRNVTTKLVEMINCELNEREDDSNVASDCEEDDEFLITDADVEIIITEAPVAQIKGIQEALGQVDSKQGTSKKGSPEKHELKVIKDISIEIPKTVDFETVENSSSELNEDVEPEIEVVSLECDEEEEFDQTTNNSSKDSSNTVEDETVISTQKESLISSTTDDDDSDVEICTIDSPLDNSINTNLSSLTLESSPRVPTPARRVARKSTRPPLNPQRMPECPAELLLFEMPVTNLQTPSPKRKLESAVTSGRKVARKSTRPPVNPQRTLFTEEVENSLENNSRGEMDVSSLLDTPEKGEIELEVLDEIVVG